MTLEQAREYLARVLPWPQDGEPPAFVNIHYTSARTNGDGVWWNGSPCRSVDEAVRQVKYALDRPDTQAIYACQSSQSETEEKISKRNGRPYQAAKRSAANAVRLKSFYLDIDVKKDGYPTFTAAAQALAAFLKETDLPRPTMIVNSGGGMQVYWLTARSLTRQEWQPLATALADAAKKHGLRADVQVTSDAARVLRIPNTKNLKYGEPRPVRIAGKILDFDYSVERIETALRPYMAAVVASPLPPRAPITTPSALSAGMEARPAALVDLDAVAPECGFIREALETGGRNYYQPIWNLSVLLATFCEDGRAQAHRMSEQHEAYTKEDTDALYDRKVAERAKKDMGWPSCAAISAAGCMSCVTCPHKSEGKGPLAFRPVPVPKKADDLPLGYTRNDEGMVFVSTPGDDGTAETKLVCDYPMTNPWMQRDPWVLHFTTKLLTGEETTVAVTAEELGEQGGSTRALHRAALVLHAHQRTAMQEFLVSWVQKLQQTKDAVVSSAPFGWFAEHGKTVGFIYGGRLWRSDGTNAPAANPDPVVARQYAPAGDRQRWCDAYDLIGNQEHAPLDAIVATAFAAPLVMFTGHEGLLMCAYSTESGIGKTTALKVAQGVWGSPIDAKQGLKDTELSVFKKLGEIKSLPLYWDELKSEADTKRFVDIVFALSSGREKTRLTQSTALRAAGTWQTLMMSCSNESIIDYVVGHTKQTTAGLYRVFEYVVPPNTDGKGRIGKAEAQRVLAGMNGNHGSIGLEYAKWLGTNIALISTDMAVLQTALEEELVPSDDERYWMSIVACVLLGARYANELGFTRFNLDQLKKFMLTVLTGMRGERLRQPIDMKASFDVGNILAQFLGAMRARNTLYTDRIHIGAGKPHKGTVKIVRDVSRLEDLKVHVGVEDQLVRISNSGLAKWLKDTGQARGVFMRALEEQFGANTQLKATLGGGTDYNSMQQYITEIQLADHSEINFLKEE